MQLPIATGFYRSDSLPLAAQRCVNWIPVVAEAGALNQRALFDVHGLIQKSLTGSTIVGMNRGAQTMNGVPYFVNGQNLYSVDSADVVTDHGRIEGIERVSIANNGRYLVIVVPGRESYAFDNTTDTLTQITDVDFITSDTVTFKDGFFNFTASDGSVFFHSALNDPFSFNALDFGTAEIRPDKIVATHVNHNELFVPGETTIELFQNVGGSGFVYKRINGANIQKGVRARHSLVDFDNSFVFLGGAENEGTAVWNVVSSSNVRKISTSAIDSEIQKFTRDEIADAYAFTYAYGGNFFVAFTLVSSRIPSKTFVYDATTSAQSGELTWHERQSGVVENRWRATQIVEAYGVRLVGDSVDGRIGLMDKDAHTEYGDAIYREKASQPFSADGQPIFANEIKLTMESGVGTIEGLDPQIRMDFSDDGSKTFSNEQWRSYGKIGQYQMLPAWRRQGRIPRHRVLRFKTTEPVKSVIIKLEAEAS